MSKIIDAYHSLKRKMFRKMFGFVCAIINLLMNLFFSFNREKVVVSQGSEYNDIILISSCGSKRRMRFNSLQSGSQAEIDLNRIDYPSHEYIQLMIISLIYYPMDLNEKRILIIGLGGGILPRAIRKLNSNIEIIIIEIDPLVDEMAKKYFYFKEDDKMKVLINDGWNYLNCLSSDQYYDLIFVDAYDSFNQIPNQMKKSKFLSLLKSHLNPTGGFIIFNLVCISQSYFHLRNEINTLFQLNHLLTFRSKDYLNIILLVSTFQYPIEHENKKSNIIIQDLEEKLSIDFNSLLKQQQKEEFIHRITNINNNENLSLKEFIYFV